MILGGRADGIIEFNGNHSENMETRKPQRNLLRNTLKAKRSITKKSTKTIYNIWMLVLMAFVFNS